MEQEKIVVFSVKITKNSSSIFETDISCTGCPNLVLANMINLIFKKTGLSMYDLVMDDICTKTINNVETILDLKKP